MSIIKLKAGTKRFWTGQSWTNVLCFAKEYDGAEAHSIIAQRFHRGFVWTDAKGAKHISYTEVVDRESERKRTRYKERW